MMNRIRIWWQISLISFLFFVLTTIAVHYGIVDQLDHAVTSFIQNFESPLLTAIFITFTHIGSFIGTIIIFLILLYFFRRFNWRAESILLTGTVLSTPIINIILKELIQRPRPTASFLVEVSGYSFPSGHTMYAVSLYGITLTLIWFKLKRMGERIFLTIAISFMILTIAISRIYLGVHYPSDIIGGIFASNFMISFTFYLYLTERRRKRGN